MEEYTQQRQTKRCPFCGEEILAVAKKCKHCHEFLPEKEPQPENISDTPQTKSCPYCGGEVPINASKCKFCGEWFNRTEREEPVIRKIADCQRVSNVLWLVIAIIQILSIVCIIAGIWNIIATISTWGLPKKILNRDSDVPEYYCGIAGLIIMAIVNFLLGGIIGVILIGFDFYIRGLVLDNKKLFDK